jgi:hypothetical protein
LGSADPIIIVYTVPVHDPAAFKPHALEKVKPTDDVVGLRSAVICRHAELGYYHILVGDFLQVLDKKWRQNQERVHVDVYPDEIEFLAKLNRNVASQNVADSKVSIVLN